jgi:hypothetical protein
MDGDALRPWVDRIRRGDARVLTADPVRRLVPTSGSTDARKLIPFTPSLHREFAAAVGPWVVGLFRSDPDLLFGPAYWSVSPAIDLEPAGPSAVPIGFEEDADYLGGTARRLVEAALVVPGDARRAKTIEAFRRRTLVALLLRRDLRLVSVWHPSFLTLLLDALAADWDAVVADVAATDRGRADEVWRAGPHVPTSLWPDLRVVSCWADGQAAGPAAELAARLPGARVQPKGLLATEAVISVPFGEGWPLAVRSHFFEFVDAGGRVRRADELAHDGEYDVLVTTGGGLWRYRLGDVVRVVGRIGRTPSVRFVGRAGIVSDLRGEKLTDAFVARAIDAALRAAGTGRPAFAMLAPDGGGYGLFMSAPAPPALADALDDALATNPHYRYCRHLGQLAAPRVVAVGPHAYQRYCDRLALRGIRVGDVKPVALSREDGWRAWFGTG